MPFIMEKLLRLFSIGKIAKENQLLKYEVAELKLKLQNKQEDINKVNAYWKGKMRSTRKGE